ncbi:hypothetical protein HanXRQr2_Chr12g0559901 [Helianthus annuus]|uniref:Uncharacterized protein n=1 Tax=Helianthus annuus TaxID=4232 RepID=A0A9K3HJK6_HELAN|nr:hypothetical protein HanXRQr2_Chr12g0559901 [Helianthus annuus]
MKVGPGLHNKNPVLGLRLKIKPLSEIPNPGSFCRTIRLGLGLPNCCLNPIP